jgi:hypothetical protein
VSEFPGEDGVKAIHMLTGRISEPKEREGSDIFLDYKLHIQQRRRHAKSE